MNKRPSLQFYPADWLKAVDLQMCSMNTIGIWINLLCRMWEAKEEGILSGKPGELALLVGAKPGEFKRFLREAGEHKFCDVLHNVTDCYAVVTIKCRRMNGVFLERERVKIAMREHRLQKSDVPSSSSSSTTKIYSAFMDYWNTQKNLPKIKRFTPTRIIKFKARLKEDYFAENWRLIVQKISATPFLTGDNDRNWRADVSWILSNSDNYIKVMEGKYDNNKKSKPMPSNFGR